MYPNMSILVRERDVSRLQNVQTSSGAQRASYSVATLFLSQG